MGLIEYKDVELFSDHEFSDSHTVGHESDFGFGRALFFESDIVTNLLTQSVTHFVRYSFSESDGTDSSGLCNEDSIVIWEKVLRDLGCFAWPCLPANHSHSVLFYRVNDLLFVLENWQVLLNVLDFSRLLLALRNHL